MKEEDFDRYKMLKGERSTVDTLRESIARVMATHQIGFTTKLTPGTDRTTEAYSNTPAEAADRLAASVESMLMPNGTNWIQISSGDEEIDEEHDVASWLDRANEDAFKFIYAPAANFQSTKGEISLPGPPPRQCLC